MQRIRLKWMSRRTCAERRGFSLGELLIVILILGILSAIAVPNLLEYRVRAKITRVASDLRTIGAAIEAYAVDWNHYPLNDLSKLAVLPAELTTPTPYLPSNRLIDPFSPRDRQRILADVPQFYRYTEIVDLRTARERIEIGRPVPAEAIDHPLYNPGAFLKYGAWRAASYGPDRTYVDPDSGPWSVYSGPWGIDLSYDPSNGTVSSGNIIRTHRGMYGL